MKAQCCICSDQFDDASSIAAIACGHTFHYTCLQRWIGNKNTCPHCRKPVQKNLIIPKLYFDKVEDDIASSSDSGHIANELADVRVKLRLAQKESSESAETLKMVQQSLDLMIESQSQTEKQLRTEESENKSLRTKIAKMEAHNNLAMEQKEEIKRVKDRMALMVSVDRILSESRPNLREILCQHQTVADLATVLAALQREFEITKQDKKAIKSELDDVRRKLIVKGQQLAEVTKDSEFSRQQLKRSEEDLKNFERERDLLKRKYEKLKLSARISSRNVGATIKDGAVVSDVEETLEEAGRVTCQASCTENKSPPAAVREVSGNAFTPPLFGDESLNLSADDELSLVEFAPTEVVKTPEIGESYRAQLRRECEDADASFVEFAKPVENPVKMKKRKLDSETRDRSLATMNIFKNMKKKGFCDYSSSLRTNYNGLGGHSTFTQTSRLRTGPSNSQTIRKGTLNHFLSKYS